MGRNIIDGEFKLFEISPFSFQIAAKPFLWSLRAAERPLHIPKDRSFENSGSYIFWSASPAMRQCAWPNILPAYFAHKRPRCASDHNKAGTSIHSPLLLKARSHLRSLVKQSRERIPQSDSASRFHGPRLELCAPRKDHDLFAYPLTEDHLT